MSHQEAQQMLAILGTADRLQHTLWRQPPDEGRVDALREQLRAQLLPLQKQYRGDAELQTKRQLVSLLRDVLLHTDLKTQKSLRSLRVAIDLLMETPSLDEIWVVREALLRDGYAFDKREMGHV